MPKTDIHIIRTTDSNKNFLENRREELNPLYTYAMEQALMDDISNGNIRRIDSRIEAMKGQNIYVGNLSDDDLRFTKYTAVIFIAQIIRAAIKGGLPEVNAYAFSDESIQHIDKLNDASEIVSYMFHQMREITARVYYLHRKKYSLPVQKCIDYIDLHLNFPVTLDELSIESGISKYYLSRSFSKEVGMSIPKYHEKMRLEAAKEILLTSNKTMSEVAAQIGFSSQSYFISRFKATYDKTPVKWLKEQENRKMEDYFK